MPASIESPLRVHHMRVTWRDTFVVPEAGPNFLARARDHFRNLPTLVSDSLAEPHHAQPEFLRVVERVSRSVAPIGHRDLLRVQLAPLEIADLDPTLDRLRIPPDALTAGQIAAAGADADAAETWIAVTPLLVLHRAGVCIVEYHAGLRSREGLSVDEAVARVRLGIAVNLLALGEPWRDLLPTPSVEGPVHEVVTTQTAPERMLVAMRLRDLTQSLIAAGLIAAVTAPPGRRARRAGPSVQADPPRPTGSTSVVLVETDPQAGDDFEAFCTEHGLALRGIGALDADWRNRAGWLVARELGNNLSTDAEMALYLLGTSELMLFNARVRAALAANRRRLRGSEAGAALLFTAHYGVLMEWVYLQEAILKAYLGRLDALASSPAPDRARTIEALQGALADMVQYQEDITPYATRVEFLQRARAYRGVDALAERFEHKQDLLLSYASEFHDFREARATEFLNWLAGILTGAALAELITTLTGINASQPALYVGITLGSIALVLAVMALLLRRVRR